MESKRSSIISRLIDEFSAKLEKEGISPANPQVAANIITALTKVGLVGYDDLVAATAAIETRTSTPLLDDATAAELGLHDDLTFFSKALGKQVLIPTT